MYLQAAGLLWVCLRECIISLSLWVFKGYFPLYKANGISESLSNQSFWYGSFKMTCSHLKCIDHQCNCPVWGWKWANEQGDFNFQITSLWRGILLYSCYIHKINRYHCMASYRIWWHVCTGEMLSTYLKILLYSSDMCYCSEWEYGKLQYGIHGTSANRNVSRTCCQSSIGSFIYAMLFLPWFVSTWRAAKEAFGLYVLFIGSFKATGWQLGETRCWAGMTAALIQLCSCSYFYKKLQSFSTAASAAQCPLLNYMYGHFCDK